MQVRDAAANSCCELTEQHRQKIQRAATCLPPQNCAMLAHYVMKAPGHAGMHRTRCECADAQLLDSNIRAAAMQRVTCSIGARHPWHRWQPLCRHHRAGQPTDGARPPRAAAEWTSQLGHAPSVFLSFLNPENSSNIAPAVIQSAHVITIKMMYGEYTCACCILNLRVASQ